MTSLADTARGLDESRRPRARIPERTVRYLALIAVLMVGLSGRAPAAEPTANSGTVYVPVYSHIYGGPRSRAINLTVTLCVRNTDPAEPMEIRRVNYHDSEGHLIKNYLDKPAQLPPLGTRRFIVEEADTRGGSGAAFLVKWTAQNAPCPPSVQAVHISTGSGQGISFLTEGRSMRPSTK